MYNYLQPGVVVKDKAGIRKATTRIDGDKVYWVYSERSDRRQHAADYERFIDTHFIIPDMRTRLPEAA
jgi:hypothetical protein